MTKDEERSMRAHHKSTAKALKESPGFGTALTAIYVHDVGLLLKALDAERKKGKR